MTLEMANRTSNSLGAISVPPPSCGGAEQGKDPAVEARRDPFSSAQTAGNADPLSIPEQWLSLHGDALFRYALLLVVDVHRAEDLVQETLLSALEGRARYSAAASERTWLIAILRNKVMDERRRDRRHDEYLADVDPVVEGNFDRFGKWRKPPGRWTPKPQSLLESQEFWVIVQGCMRALPAQMREAFALRVVEGLDAPEICRILEVTSVNLWTLLSRARERLRRCLEGKWFIKEEI
jgi:RNA polymerase sigma-70 factor (TIGR02943 family)